MQRASAGGRACVRACACVCVRPSVCPSVRACVRRRVGVCACVLATQVGVVAGCRLRACCSTEGHAAESGCFQLAGLAETTTANQSLAQLPRPAIHERPTHSMHMRHTYTQATTWCSNAPHGSGKPATHGTASRICLTGSSSSARAACRAGRASASWRPPMPRPPPPPPFWTTRTLRV
jgi:hypothetical protein